MGTQAQESITLYYRADNSDKVYSVYLREKQEAYVVDYQFGARGSTLTVGTKTATPVSYAQAKKIYDKLVREKMAKGYTPGEDGTPYTSSSKEERSTGIYPQLLVAADEPLFDLLLESPDFLAQEKYDGRRVMIKKSGSEVVGINREGLLVEIPTSVRDAFRGLMFDFLLDGESIGDVYITFDCLSLQGADISSQGYEDRMKKAIEIASLVDPVVVRSSSTALTPAAKHGLVNALRKNLREGVVFKRRNAPYKAGRPKLNATVKDYTSADQFKFKFVETASCIVSDVTSGKRSVGLLMLDPSGSHVNVGKVTIPVNHDMPSAGQIVEVRYLYGYKGGSLYQPVYLSVRDDIRPSACVTGQIKYKPESRVSQ